MRGLKIEQCHGTQVRSNLLTTTIGPRAACNLTPPYNAHVGPQIHDDRYRRGPRVYDISALLTASIIIGAETAPFPAQLPTPSPSLSTTGANLHTFPLRTSTSPAACSTGTNLEQGQPHGDVSGDFEAPDPVKDPIRRVLFDFGRATLAPNVETFAAVPSRATLELADRGGSSAMPSNGLVPLCFGL